jgi:hypothetical protein
VVCRTSECKDAAHRGDTYEHGGNSDDVTADPTHRLHDRIG